jgi:BolA protein
MIVADVGSKPVKLGPVGIRIKSKLERAFAPISLELIDESHLHAGHAGAHPEGESHFRVRIVSREFSGKSRVDRHRMINQVLEDELRAHVHALAIHAAPPEQ